MILQFDGCDQVLRGCEILNGHPATVTFHDLWRDGTWKVLDSWELKISFCIPQNEASMFMWDNEEFCEIEFTEDHLAMVTWDTNLETVFEWVFNNKSTTAASILIDEMEEKIPLAVKAWKDELGHGFWVSKTNINAIRNGTVVDGMEEQLHELWWALTQRYAIRFRRSTETLFCHALKSIHQYLFPILH